MMKRRCWFTIVLMVLFMLCLPITAVAQDRSPISQVSVTVTQEVTTGTANKPDVYANSEQYYIFDKPKFEKMLKASMQADHGWLVKDGPIDQYAQSLIDLKVFEPSITASVA